ncbi:nucleotide-diphospho-sugar transferase [Kockovaella imperatae]|uniref:Nucleotide-diphospho-sugar transferase n=1 Tax=Kockovaella imperatae TaxID=4999 RepID=A0A1Y1US91_9TREE|nr:nucleotide-diphospho-sugar transferase [Kockovaella imperatae]ORX40888.1 nucleotide-diphospho-sugar transferase [Kockovaella imperatae]
MGRESEGGVPLSPYKPASIDLTTTPYGGSPSLKFRTCLRAASLPLIFALTSMLVVLTTLSLQPPGTLNTILAFLNPFYQPSSSSSISDWPTVHLQQSTTEAYATFLSDIGLDPIYLLQTRLLLFQIKHDRLTADPMRDFVVLTTPNVPVEIEDQLREEGAVVIRRPFVLGMPGEAADLGDNIRWKDQYSKLNIFNLTQYERILYLDSDTILTRSLEGIWTEEAAWPKYGLASVGVDEEVAQRPGKLDGSEFNGGFWLARPSEDLFTALLKQEDYDPFYLEQALLNHYFSWTGDAPWTALKPEWNTIHPTEHDLVEGVATLHGHFWELDADDQLGDFWLTTIGRMERYWMEKETHSRG